MTFDGSAPPLAWLRAARAFWSSRARATALLAALALFGTARHVKNVGRAAVPGPYTPEAAVVSALDAQGLKSEPSDVVWIDGPSGVRGALLGGARALVRAGQPGEPKDLYLVSARRAPGGAVLSVDGAWNVTDTSGVDESRPVVRGSIAAYLTTDDGLVSGLHVLDL
ncbi:MAG: hypothetical protein FWD17_09605, partial [Polyangiaceae bacterium]|nr:hypothetical protein [Polyangiaceae bacterium]